MLVYNEIPSNAKALGNFPANCSPLPRRSNEEVRSETRDIVARCRFSCMRVVLSVRVLGGRGSACGGGDALTDRKVR